MIFPKLLHTYKVVDHEHDKHRVSRTAERTRWRQKDYQKLINEMVHNHSEPDDKLFIIFFTKQLTDFLKIYKISLFLTPV